MKANRRDPHGNMYAKVIVPYFVGLEELKRAAVSAVAEKSLSAHDLDYAEIVAGLTRKDVERNLKKDLETYGAAWLDGDLGDYIVGLYNPGDVDDVLEMVSGVVEDLFPDFRWGQ